MSCPEVSLFLLDGFRHRACVGMFADLERTEREAKSKITDVVSACAKPLNLRPFQSSTYPGLR